MLTNFYGSYFILSILKKWDIINQNKINQDELIFKDRRIIWTKTSWSLKSNRFATHGRRRILSQLNDSIETEIFEALTKILETVKPQIQPLVAATAALWSKIGVDPIRKAKSVRSTKTNSALGLLLIEQNEPKVEKWSSTRNKNKMINSN